MRAVRGGESIIDENVAQRRHLFGEVQVVLFFAGMEAGVFQQKNLAVLERLDGAFGFRPNTIFREGDGAADRVRQRRDHRLQRHGWHDLALGAVEMAEAR